jgi:hypothetical protein
MKAGGAEVRILHTPTPNLGDENWRGALITNAKAVASYDEPGSQLVGYLLVGFFSDGTVSTGYRWDAARTPIPRALMPAFVEEVVRRDMITSAEADEVACKVVNRANGYEPD